MFSILPLYYGIMTQIPSKSQIKIIFNDKNILQFLDDSYNLSKSKKTREVYGHVLRSFNKFCYVKYDKDLTSVIDELKVKPLEDTLDVFLNFKRYLDNFTTRRHLPV